MAEVKTFQTIPIVAAGLSLAVDITQYTEYLITGTCTLTGSVTITPTGTPAIGTECVFKYEGNIQLGSSSITVFGRVLTEDEALSFCYITARWDDSVWDGSVWVVDVIMSNNGVTFGKAKVISSSTPEYLSGIFTNSIVFDVLDKGHLDGDLPTSGIPDNSVYGKRAGSKGWFPELVLANSVESNWIPITGITTLGSIPVVLPTTYQNIRKIVVTAKRITTGWTAATATGILIKAANGASLTTLATIPISVIETNVSAYGYNTYYAVITAPVNNNELFTNIIFTTNDGSDLSGGDYTLFAKIYYEPIIQMP
jgi:hypothetical protein